MLYTGKPTEVITNYDPENTTAILAIPPYSSQKGTTLVVLVSDVNRVNEIVRTLKQQEYKNVRAIPINKVRWFKAREYNVIEYDKLTDVKIIEEYNAAEVLRKCYYKELSLVRKYHYHGTYRQQNIIRVLTSDEYGIIDVTSLIHAAITLPYNYKHGGIHVDSSDYRNEIKLQLKRHVSGYDPIVEVL